MQVVCEGASRGHHEPSYYNVEGGTDVEGGDHKEEEHEEEERDRRRHWENTDEDHYMMIYDHLRGVDA